MPNLHFVRSTSSRLALSCALTCFVATAVCAQEPTEWEHFDADDPVRRLENRFALIASDGLAHAGDDARALAAALERYGWSVRLFGAGLRAPGADDWKRDWSDLAETLSPKDTVLVSWISAGPPHAEIASWTSKLAALPAAHRVLLIDALRCSPTELRERVGDLTPEPSWPKEVTALLTAAWGASSLEHATREAGAEAMEPVAHGLYLDAFLRALASKSGDLNGDRYVSCFEAHHVSSASSARRAFDLGRAQRARISNESQRDVWLRDLRAQEVAPTRAVAAPAFPFRRVEFSTRLELEEREPSDPRLVPRSKYTPFYATTKVPKEALLDSRGRALAWLLSVQSADGRWDANAFPFEGDPKQAGHGSGMHDPGVTGLALLALLSASDEKEQTAAREAAIERGVRWLLTTPDKEGVLGGRKGHAFVYDHAIATHALCAALARNEIEGLRATAVLAVKNILRARNPYKAWRYELPPNGENDSSVSTWMILALDAAKRAGIEVDPAAKSGMLSLLDELTDSSTARCGYTSRGESPARPTGKADRWPSANSESLTAGALVVRELLGESETENPMLQAHVDLLCLNSPRPSEDGSTHDFIYWYFGARALAPREHGPANRWCEALALALVSIQVRPSSPAAGSFVPNDPWGDESGRIGTTAYGVLALSELLEG